MRFPVNFLRYRIIGLSGLVLAACLLQACSAVKIAYNQAHELAYWHLDGYVDFNPSQSLLLKEELAKLQAWHRKTQLPGYIETLQKLKQKMPGEIDAAQACEVFFDVRRKLVAVSDQAEPAALALAATLNPDQLARMERKFAKGNADYVEDLIEATAKASRNKRYKRAVKRAEMLYGQLDDKQLGLIGQTIGQSRFDARLSYTERVRRQRDTSQALRAIAATPAAIAASTATSRSALRGLFERSLNSPNIEYREYLEKLTQDNCRSFADLHNSTTEAQRRKAVEIINGYVLDLKALMGRS